MKAGCVISMRIIFVCLMSTLFAGTAANFDSRNDSVTNNTNKGSSCGDLTPKKFKLELNQISTGKIHLENNKQCFCKPPKRTCDIQCFPCDNDQNRCSFYGTCCSPELDSQAPTTVCHDFGEFKHYLTVRSCPSDYQDHNTSKLCEQNTPWKEANWETNTIVTDTNTNVSYYNTFCAKCNGAEKVCQWRLGVKCTTYDKVIGATSEEDLLRESLKPRSSCQINQEPCIEEPYPCDPQFFQREGAVYVDKCNAFKENKFSSRVKQECLTQHARLRDRVVTNNLISKNIFCLLCNRKGHCDAGSSSHVGNFVPPFQYMFGLEKAGFPDEPGNVETSCAKDEWMDPEGNCRRLSCTEGKVLKSNHCETALKQIAGLNYKMSFLLVSVGHYKGSGPTFSTLNMEKIKRIISKKIIQLFVPVTNYLNIYIGIFSQRQVLWRGSHETANSKNDSLGFFVLPKFVWAKVILRSKKNISRDVVENQLLSFYYNPDFHVTMMKYYNSSYKFLKKQPFDDNLCASFSKEQCAVTMYSAMIIEGEIIVSPAKEMLEGKIKENGTLEVNGCLMCPSINVSEDEVKQHTSIWPVPQISITLGSGKSVEISEILEMKQVCREENGDTYLICLDLLKSKFEFQQLKRLTLSRLSDVIQYILTIICVTASLVCLCATIITYSLFPRLRNVAGCNMMGLSSSLLVAQLLLMVANTITGPSVECMTIGLATHYSWLVMFTWMFLCCLHTLRVFTSINLNAASSTEKSERKTVSMYVTLSLLIPALVVIVIVVTNVVMYDRTRIGYGHYSCGVDSVFAIYGPLIFVIACNVIFFTIVVTKIWNVRRLQQNEEKKKDLVVYIKLSTLTGMFWVLVILGEMFQNDVIRCLAIVFNGGQGAFVFASFTANHRVLKCFRDKFKFGQTPSNGS